MKFKCIIKLVLDVDGVGEYAEGFDSKAREVLRKEVKRVAKRLEAGLKENSLALPGMIINSAVVNTRHVKLRR